MLRFTKRLTAIFLTAMLMMFAAFATVDATEGVAYITTQQALLEAIQQAQNGDVLMVGDIDFTAPDGIFNDMMRVQLSKSIIIRSGYPDRKAVFTNGSFLLRGSKVSGQALECVFENIVFDGNVDTFSLTAADWERPYDPSVDAYTAELPLKAQYAVSFAGNVNASFHGCVFQNYMHEYGGAMWCRYRDYTDNPYFLDLYGDYSGCQLDIQLTDCCFTGNTACYAGGAVYLDGNQDNVRFRAEGCTFENNFVALNDLAEGGGGVFAQYASVELLDCQLIGNEANRDCGMTAGDGDRTRGGAVYVSNGSLRMVNCQVKNNQASLGGGLTLTNAPTTVDGCVLAENCAASKVASDISGPWASVGIGGAMYVETENAIPVSVYNSSIYRNSAANAYGGIYGFYNEDYAGLLSQGFGKLDFALCTIMANHCDAEFDYSASDMWLWYSHPGDVWTVPYVTATGCLILEEAYEEDFPRNELPSLENGYNYYGFEASVQEDPVHGHITSCEWEIPTDHAEQLLDGDYMNKRSTVYVGSNYDVSIYQPGKPPTVEEPSTEPLSPTWTEPTPTPEQTHEVPVQNTPNTLYRTVWLIIPGGCILIVIAVLLLTRKRSGKVVAVKEQPEVQIPVETAPKPKIVMTRYSAEQISRIVQQLPHTQRLTTRELEVFQEMLTGKKQGEIAYELGISVPTVKDNARRIYDKLEVQNKNELFIKVQDYL